MLLVKLTPLHEHSLVDEFSGGFAHQLALPDGALCPWRLALVADVDDGTECHDGAGFIVLERGATVWNPYFQTPLYQPLLSALDVERAFERSPQSSITAQLVDIKVRPDLRGRGFGRAILERAAAYTLSRWKALTLWARPQQPAHFQMLKKRGFCDQTPPYGVHMSRPTIGTRSSDPWTRFVQARIVENALRRLYGMHDISEESPADLDLLRGFARDLVVPSFATPSEAHELRTGFDVENWAEIWGWQEMTMERALAIVAATALQTPDAALVVLRQCRTEAQLQLQLQVPEGHPDRDDDAAGPLLDVLVGQAVRDFADHCDVPIGTVLDTSWTEDRCRFTPALRTYCLALRGALWPLAADTYLERVLSGAPHGTVREALSHLAWVSLGAQASSATKQALEVNSWGPSQANSDRSVA